MKKLLIIDFDRTIFKTDFFIEKLWQVISDYYKLKYLDMMAEIPKYYHARGELRYYDFVLHFQEATGQTVDALEKFRPELSGANYQYDDVGVLGKFSGKYDLRLLSFGEQWFQTFKMSFSHIASRLPRDIILAAKNEFVAKNFADRQGILVDDKRNPGLPSGFTEIWLNRNGEIPKTNSIITINSLTQLPEVLHELY